MHTATRIAAAALPKIRALAPHARFAAFGLYAPVNAAWLKTAWGWTRFSAANPNPICWPGCNGGSRTAAPSCGATRSNSCCRIVAVCPTCNRYARLMLADGTQNVIGFAEASRGCKHLCRHCPVVPVYEGKFRIVPVEW